MNNDREELVDEMQQAGYYADIDASWAECGVIVRHALDALGADPVRVLRWLEGLPCQTCGGTGEQPCIHGPGTSRCGHPDCIGARGFHDAVPCSACGGGGILGRDGVLRLLGMERLGFAHDELVSPGDVRLIFPTPDAHASLPVFARVPVPEPSEGETP